MCSSIPLVNEEVKNRVDFFFFFFFGEYLYKVLVTPCTRFFVNFVELTNDS